MRWGQKNLKTFWLSPIFVSGKFDKRPIKVMVPEFIFYIFKSLKLTSIWKKRKRVSSLTYVANGPISEYFFKYFSPQKKTECVMLLKNSDNPNC
jgi:hypothetical protein